MNNNDNSSCKKFHLKTALSIISYIGYKGENNICKRIIMIVLKSMIFRKDGYLIHIVDTCSVTFAFLGENA